MLNRRLLLSFTGMLLGAMMALQPLAASAANLGAAADTSAIPYVQVGSGEPATTQEQPAAEENVGFPQLNTKTYASQVLWLFAAFLTLYVLMSKMALPGVASVLEARRAHKDGDLKRAEQLQEEAAKVKTAYEAALAKAQSDAQDALSAAEQDIAEKIAAENAKFGEAARKRVATAEQNIAKAKAEALSSLADISADIAAEMVNKVAAVQVGKAEAKKAVTTVMQKEAA